MSNSDNLDSPVPIDGLIKLSGESPIASDMCRARVEAAVKAAWVQKVVEMQKLNDSEAPSPSQRRPWLLKFKRKITRFFLERSFENSRWNLRHFGAQAMVCVLAVVLPFVFWSRDDVEREYIADVLLQSGHVTYEPLGDSASGEVNAIFAGQTISTAQGAGLSIALDQGQSIRLDENTQLIALSSRHFRLSRGAIYFDSGNRQLEHAARAITVETAYASISDIGTQFSVRFSDQILDVRVREGEVRLYSSENTHLSEQGSSQSLVKEQAMRLTKGEEPTRFSVATDDTSWRWAENLAPAFDPTDRTLDEYLGWFCREKGWELEYQNRGLQAQAKQDKLRGNFQTLTPKAMFLAALAVNNLSYTQQQRKLVIHQKKD